MHIEASRTFIKYYKKVPQDIRERTKKALELLQANPLHPSLGLKKMAGQTDIYEIRISDNYRITYFKQGDTAILRKVGPHDILQNP